MITMAAETKRGSRGVPGVPSLTSSGPAQCARCLRVARRSPRLLALSTSPRRMGPWLPWWTQQTVHIDLSIFTFVPNLGGGPMIARALALSFIFVACTQAPTYWPRLQRIAFDASAGMVGPSIVHSRCGAFRSSKAVLFSATLVCWHFPDETESTYVPVSWVTWLHDQDLVVGIFDSDRLWGVRRDGIVVDFTAASPLVVGACDVSTGKCCLLDDCELPKLSFRSVEAPQLKALSRTIEGSK